MDNLILSLRNEVEQSRRETLKSKNSYNSLKSQVEIEKRTSSKFNNTDNIKIKNLEQEN